MRSSVRVLGLASAMLLVPFLSLSAQDKGDSPKESTRSRQLPANWAKLGLSAEQKEKVYAVQNEFKAQIDALQKQLAELRKKERTALEAVLTDGQKARLREILLEKAPGGKSDKPDSKPGK